MAFHISVLLEENKEEKTAKTQSLIELFLSGKWIVYQRKDAAVFAKLKKQPNENCVISLTCTLNIRFTWGQNEEVPKKKININSWMNFNILEKTISPPPTTTKTEYIYIQLHVLNKQFSPYHVQSWHENGKVLPRFLQGSAAKWEGKGVEEKGERWKGGG